MGENDPTVADTTLLYRRLHPRQLIWDPNRQRIRATSDVYKDVELSVGLGDELANQGLNTSWLLRVDPQHQLACFTAMFARAEEQAIWRDPLVDDERYGDDPTHGIVEGAKPKSRRTRWVEESDVLVLQPEALSDELRERYEQSAPDVEGPGEVA